MCEVLLGCRKSNDSIRKDFECGFWVINVLMKGQRAKSRESGGLKLVFSSIHGDIFILKTLDACSGVPAGISLTAAKGLH